MRFLPMSDAPLERQRLAGHQRMALGMAWAARRRELGGEL
jgi:hypothetical protein